VRHRHWSPSLIGWGFIFTLLLPACTAPAPQPTNLPPAASLTRSLADSPPANLKPETLKLETTYLQQAAHYYNRYHALAPDDLLGLKRLAGVCTALEKLGQGEGETRGQGEGMKSCREAAERVSGSMFQVSSSKPPDEPETPNLKPETLKLETTPAAVLREALAARTDDRRIVAELLGVSVEDVELGPNLVENGGFDEWVEGRPEWWTWSDMFNHEPFNAAAFAGGVDGLLSFEGQQAARVDGFWIQQQEDKSRARCGYWQQWDEEQHSRRSITLTVGSPYLLSFYYRTENLANGAATVWVSYDPMVLFAHDHGLPSTGEDWHHFVAVGWNRSDAEAAIRPLIRSFATGSVEFDDVQVRAIGLAEGTTVEADDTRFWMAQSD